MICLMYEWSSPFLFPDYEFLFELGVFVLFGYLGERTLDGRFCIFLALDYCPCHIYPPFKLLVYQIHFSHHMLPFSAITSVSAISIEYMYEYTRL